MNVCVLGPFHDRASYNLVFVHPGSSSRTQESLCHIDQSASVVVVRSFCRKLETKPVFPVSFSTSTAPMSICWRVCRADARVNRSNTRAAQTENIILSVHETTRRAGLP